MTRCLGPRAILSGGRTFSPSCLQPSRPRRGVTRPPAVTRAPGQGTRRRRQYVCQAACFVRGRGKSPLSWRHCNHEVPAARPLPRRPSSCGGRYQSESPWIPASVQNETFGGVTYHIEGELVPALHLELSNTGTSSPSM